MALDAKGTPLTFSSFDGQAVLRNGTISCQGCKLQTASGSYDVTGDAGFNRTLDARIENMVKGVAYVISGPLEKHTFETAVAPAAEANVR